MLLVPRSGASLPIQVQPAATRAILDQAYVDACETLAAHLPTLPRIAAYLVEAERVDGDTFDELFDDTLEVPTAGDGWRPAAVRPRDWGEVLPFRDRRFRRDVLVDAPADGPDDATYSQPIGVPAGASIAVPGAAAAASGPPEAGELGEGNAATVGGERRLGEGPRAWLEVWRTNWTTHPKPSPARTG